MAFYGLGATLAWPDWRRDWILCCCMKSKERRSVHSLWLLSLPRSPNRSPSPDGERWTLRSCPGSPCSMQLTCSREVHAVQLHVPSPLYSLLWTRKAVREWLLSDEKPSQIGYFWLFRFSALAYFDGCAKILHKINGFGSKTANAKITCNGCHFHVIIVSQRSNLTVIILL